MENNVRTFKSDFKFTYTGAIVAISIFIALLAGTAITYFVIPESIVVKILFFASLAMAIASFVVVITTSKRSYDILFNNLFLTTMKNYNAIYTEKNSLVKYALTDYDEFAQLNNEIDLITDYYSSVFILNKHVDYSNIPLEYYSIEEKIVTESSFKEYLKDIIMCSQIFRNSIIRMSYDFGEDLQKTSFTRIYHTIHELFDQEGLLIAPFDDKTGLYIYVPKISSRSLFESNLSTLISKSALTAKTINGTQIYAPKVNAVIYPYSNVSEIFPDLTYAYHNISSIIYIPKRIIKQKNDSLLHTTSNLNAINRIVAELSSIAAVEQGNKKAIPHIESTMKDIVNYCLIDQAGVILLNEDMQNYKVESFVTLDKNTPCVFPVNDPVNEELVSEIRNICDADGSFFFANREEVSGGFGKMMDVYGINSGFFYIFSYDNDRHFALIYFANTGRKEMNIDSYIRESLLVSSALISSIININMQSQKVKLMKAREDNLYKIAGVKSYSVNKKNYSIIDFSSSMRDIVPDIKAGEKCHKMLFGLEKPCKNCPLLTANKVLKEIHGEKCEISYSVNNKYSNQVELLINRIEQGDLTHNRFEPDYGVNSLYSLKERLTSLYLTKTRGYVILMTLDNLAKIVKDSGSEVFLMMFREFSDKVCANVLRSNEIYMIKSDTFAIVLPEKGKLDAVDAMEEIYAISRRNNSDDALHESLDFAYNAIRFPQQYADAAEFIRNIEKVIATRNITMLRTNTIYIEENDFYRPASRNEYILSIINDAVANDKFIIRAQPMVENGNHICGAELLIRLSDSYRDSMLNTDELVAIAGKNHKLDLISNLLIKYACALYTKHGTSLFKLKRFNQISINADYSFFDHEDFFENLRDKLRDSDVPENFIVFEVNENDLSNHFAEFKEIIPKLKRLHCGFVCDRYSSEFLSLEKLQILGIDRVKLSLSMVKDIDVISEKYNALKEMLSIMKIAKVTPCVVGVENQQQFKMLRELWPEIPMQGYYFYHPLNDKEMIEAIKHEVLAN